VVNGALFEVLDFNETYIPCFMHAVSGVLPSVLAEGEALGASGARVLEALALGIEAELAVASILMPTGYFRGFIPGGITGAIGGAVACAILGDAGDEVMRNAIGLAMNAALCDGYDRTQRADGLSPGQARHGRAPHRLRGG
jgi:2-methylcitrate dehydratase PrpD